MDTLTLSEYIDATRDTLQYWLDIHTNAEKWAAEWNIDDDWQYTLKSCPKIENLYFEFDLKAACAKQYAKQYRNTFRVCSKCGDMLEDQYSCENCGSERTRKAKIGELTDWLLDIEAVYPDSIIEDAMIKQGFKVYRVAIKDVIAPVIEEVKHCLKQFRGTPDQWLQAATWANHICHVNGNIVRDYGDRCGLDYDLVNRVSQESLAAVFGQDAIDEYLAD